MVSESYLRGLWFVSYGMAVALAWLLVLGYGPFRLMIGLLIVLTVVYPLAFLFFWILVRVGPWFVRPRLVLRREGSFTRLGLDR